MCVEHDENEVWFACLIFNILFTASVKLPEFSLIQSITHESPLVLQSLSIMLSVVSPGCGVSCVLCHRTNRSLNWILQRNRWGCKHSLSCQTHTDAKLFLTVDTWCPMLYLQAVLDCPRQMIVCAMWGWTCLLALICLWSSSALVLSDLGDQLLREEPFQLSHFLRQAAHLRPQTDVLSRMLSVPGVLQRGGAIIPRGQSLVLLSQSTSRLLPRPQGLTGCPTVPRRLLLVPHLHVWPHRHYRWFAVSVIRGRRHLPDVSADTDTFEAELVRETP